MPHKLEVPLFFQQRRTLIKAIGWGLLIPFGVALSKQTPSTSTTPRSIVNAKISLLTASPGSLIDSQFAGLSYEKNKLQVPLFTNTNTALINLFGLLGPSVLRISAYEVDHTSWNGVVGGLPAITPSSIDALASFAQATSWKIIYGINLAKNTVSNAVAEAKYVANQLGDNLMGFEIGNEPDLYKSSGDRPKNWSYADFLREWQEIVRAIRTELPNANFIGPAAAYDPTYSIPFAHDTASQTVMLTHHYYRANGQLPSSTLDLLLQADPGLPAWVKKISMVAKDNHLPFGFRMGECNSFYNNGAPNISNTYGTALWALDYLFICAINGCSGVNFHGGGNSNGYTPIADIDGKIESARPEFYGITLFAKAAQGRAVPTAIALDRNINFTAYGVMRNDGGVNFVLINKDQTTTVTANLNLGIQAEGLQALTLTGPSLLSTSGQLLNGAPINADGSWIAAPGQTYPVSNVGIATLNIPPISAILLRSHGI